MEKVIGVLWEMIYLIIFVSVFLYFLRSKKTYSFVKGIFLTACSFQLTRTLFETLTYQLDIEAIKRLFGWDGSLSFIPQYLGMMGYFLLVFGITLMLGEEYSSREGATEHQILQGNRRNIGISLLLFVVTLGVYFPFWLYRTVNDLKKNFDAEIPYTAGKAVGFCFIPIFNLFWFLYVLFSLPKRMQQIEGKYFRASAGFHFHYLLIPVLLILFSLLSNLQISSSLGKSKIAEVLFFMSATFVLWLTIQAKLNAFFDFRDHVVTKEVMA
jgi:hypothetical protein